MWPQAGRSRFRTQRREGGTKEQAWGGRCFSLRMVGQLEAVEGASRTWRGPGRGAAGPTPPAARGLEPGAAALMRRCCCPDSALQGCLCLFYFSIIKTQVATQPVSPAVGGGETWAEMAKLAKRSNTGRCPS